MSVLEWLLITEGILIVTAAFFYGVSILVAGRNPDDPLSVFWNTFWKVLRRRRPKVKIAIANFEAEKARAYEQAKQEGDVDAIKDLLRDHLDGEDVDESELAAMLEADAAERGVELPALDVDSPDAAGKPNVAQINVKVIPFAERDEVVSMSKDGITISVMTAAESGSSNKVVINLIAGALGVKSYQVSLLKGHYKPRKTLQVAGLTQDSVDMRLASLS